MQSALGAPLQGLDHLRLFGELISEHRELFILRMDLAPQLANCLLELGHSYGR